MIKIPSVLDEIETIGLLAQKFNLLFTPGSAFGMPGYLRKYLKKKLISKP